MHIDTLKEGGYRHGGDRRGRAKNSSLSFPTVDANPSLSKIWVSASGADSARGAFHHLVEDLSPAVREEAVTQDERSLPGGELARGRLHRVSTRA